MGILSRLFGTKNKQNDTEEAENLFNDEVLQQLDEMAEEKAKETETFDNETLTYGTLYLTMRLGLTEEILRLTVAELKALQKEVAELKKAK